jgi:hypothetical protein
MTPWQPIDTAPKDGTEILVWNGFRISLVSWSEYPQISRRAKKMFAWCVSESEQDEQGGCATAGNPTHWQPLPEPPEE